MEYSNDQKLKACIITVHKLQKIWSGKIKLHFITFSFLTRKIDPQKQKQRKQNENKVYEAKTIKNIKYEAISLNQLIFWFDLKGV